MGIFDPKIDEVNPVEQPSGVVDSPFKMLSEVAGNVASGIFRGGSGGGGGSGTDANVSQYTEASIEKIRAAYQNGDRRTAERLTARMALDLDRFGVSTGPTTSIGQAYKAELGFDIGDDLEIEDDVRNNENFGGALAAERMKDPSATQEQLEQRAAARVQRLMALEFEDAETAELFEAQGGVNKKIEQITVVADQAMGVMSGKIIEGAFTDDDFNLVSSAFEQQAAAVLAGLPADLNERDRAKVEQQIDIQRKRISALQSSAGINAQQQRLLHQHIMSPEFQGMSPDTQALALTWIQKDPMTYISAAGSASGGLRPIDEIERMLLGPDNKRQAEEVPELPTVAGTDNRDLTGKRTDSAIDEFNASGAGGRVLPSDKAFENVKAITNGFKYTAEDYKNDPTLVKSFVAGSFSVAESVRNIAANGDTISAEWMQKNFGRDYWKEFDDIAAVNPGAAVQSLDLVEEGLIAGQGNTMAQVTALVGANTGLEYDANGNVSMNPDIDEKAKARLRMVAAEAGYSSLHSLLLDENVVDKLDPEEHRDVLALLGYTERNIAGARKWVRSPGAGTFSPLIADYKRASDLEKQGRAYGDAINAANAKRMEIMIADDELGKPYRDLAGAEAKNVGLDEDQGVAVTPLGDAPEGSTASNSIGKQYGLDFTAMETENNLPLGYLNTIAYLESSGNANAQNPNSSAGGLFQQIDSNWAQWGPPGTSRFDPAASTQAAVGFAVANMKQLERNIGRKAEGWELYLAHQQGGGGASALLRNPNERAVNVLMRVAGISQTEAERRITLNGGRPNMTSIEFASLWKNKYNRVLGSGVNPAAPSPNTDAAVQEAMTGTEAPSGTVVPNQAPLNYPIGDDLSISNEGEKIGVLFEQGGNGFTAEEAQAVREKYPQLDGALSALSADVAENVIKKLVEGEKTNAPDNP